jgi:hypothetical protein
MTGKKPKVRISLLVAADLAEAIKDASDVAGISRQEILRKALTWWQITRDAKRPGDHLGYTKDPTKLDRELIGPF